MKNSLVFKEITQLNTSYFNLHEILPALLKKGNIHLEFFFFYLSKVFDTVDHQILIKKLQYYGTDGTELESFKNYLTNRKKYISSQDISESCLYSPYFTLSQKDRFFHRSCLTFLLELTYQKRTCNSFFRCIN